jgi:hypothetical protein
VQGWGCRVGLGVGVIAGVKFWYSTIGGIV